MANEEISAGVKILLERGKTNPDELREEYGPWGQLREAVFDYKESKRRSAWLRGLTDHEIDLMFEMFNGVCRSTFDAWVMKNVLGAGEEEEDVGSRAYQMSQGKRAAYAPSWTDPRLSQIANTVQPSATYQVEKAAEQLGLTHLLKRKIKKGLGL